MSSNTTTLDRRPPIDPRIRRRRMEVRRQAGRRRLRFFLLAFSLTTLVGAGWAASRSPLLDIDRVRIQGLKRVTAAEVERATGVRPGMAMVDLDEGAAEKAATRIPWIKDAWVVRQWPGTVSIEVVERVPVAAVPAGPATWALVDETGLVTAHVGQRETAIPLEGVAPHPVGAKLAPEALALVRVAAAAPADLRGRAEAITATPYGLELRLGAVRLGVSATVPVRLGAPDHLWEKFTALRAVLAGADLATAGAIDVRLPANPVVRRNEP